jgi:hypothetical protein
MAAMPSGAGPKGTGERRRSPRYNAADARATVVIADSETLCLDWGATGFKTTAAAGFALKVGDRFSGSFRLEGANPIRFVARVVYVDRDKRHFGAAFVDPDHNIERTLDKYDPFWQPPPALA